MAKRSEIDANYIQSMWKRLEPAFEIEWNRMELVEAWRTMDKERLEGEVWSGVAAEDWGKILVLSNKIASVNSSAIAMTERADADITVRMKNTVSPASQQDANFNRRAVTNMQKSINQERTTPVESEIGDMVFTRGSCALMYGFMDQDVRGEVREEITPDLANELGDNPLVIQQDDGRIERVVEEGDFPGFLKVIDPLDCVYILGDGKRGLKLFIHAYYAEAYDVLAAYPDAMDKGVLPGTGTYDQHGSTSAVRVMDYWDEKYHAIVINDQMYYGPEEHHIGRIPVEIERVNEQMFRTWSQRYANDLVGRTTSPVVRAVTPFTWPMVDDVTKLSFAESLLASKLPEMANTPIIHYGIASGAHGAPSSPYFKKVRTTDNRESRLPRYRFIGDKTSGGRPIWPLFDGENMMPLNPTPIADHLAIFMQQRDRALEISGMNAELLSGRIRSEPSGVSVNQQIQLNATRMNPYAFAVASLIGKGYTGLFRVLAANWDRGDSPLLLVTLTDEPDMELTREQFENIMSVNYSVKNIFPRDREADLQAAFQMHAQGGMPLRELILKYDPEADPLEWLKQRAWEMMAMNDETILRALATERAKELGLDNLGPSPEAQQAAQQQQALAGPAASPAGPPPANGGAPADIPPELAAALQNVMPPQGGQ